MHKASLSASISSLTNTIIGSGLLALPSAFATMGWFLGSFFILFCAATTLFGLVLVKLSCDKIDKKASGFYDLMFRINPYKMWIIDLVIGVKCYGVTISYLIIGGTLMPQVVLSVSNSLGISSAQVPDILINKYFWYMVVVSCMIPICSVRHLKSLSMVGYLNMMAVAYIVAIMTYFSLAPDSWHLLPMPDPVVAVKWGKETLRTFPIILFAYTCSQNIIPVYNELYNSTLERTSIVTFTSVLSCAFVYLFVGLVGYFSFGAHVGNNVMAMYPDKGLFVGLGKLCVVLLAITSYPMQLYPSRASLLSLSRSWSYKPTIRTNEDGTEVVPLLPEESHSVVDSMSSLWFYGVTLAEILSGVLIALLIDDLSIVLGFVGALGSTTISFIVPAYVYCMLHANDTTHWLYRASLALGVYGVVVLLLAFGANVYKLL